MTVTRFAPSPTGFLHIGGARTALFNYLFAKKNNGKFLLRIEDTDKKRSTQEAIDAIIEGMNWLGLVYDDEIVFQTKNEARHKEVALQLLVEGKAYKCYSTSEELAKMREEAQAEGKVFKYPKIWRDKTEADSPKDAPFAVRIKAPLTGEIKINDAVQGEVSYPAEELDDLVILRADGTPTYMLAVVVDDYDMGVTDVIRGDDHLTNTFRQKVISDALGWDFPKTAHIPLIHGSDGAKLSKRHGALGVEAYRDLGYIAEAVLNYLASLGWSLGDEEKMPLADAIQKFDLSKVVKSPARFDFAKLDYINSLYLRDLPNEELFDSSEKFILEENNLDEISDEQKNVIINLGQEFAERSSNFVDFAKNTELVFKRIEYTEKALNMLEKGRSNISPIINKFEKVESWNVDSIKQVFNDYAEENSLKMGEFMPAIRAGVCGTMESPSLDLVLNALGKDEVINRLKNL